MALTNDKAETGRIFITKLQYWNQSFDHQQIYWWEVAWWLLRVIDQSGPSSPPLVLSCSASGVDSGPSRALHSSLSGAASPSRDSPTVPRPLCLFAVISGIKFSSRPGSSWVSNNSDYDFLFMWVCTSYDINMKWARRMVHNSWTFTIIHFRDHQEGILWPWMGCFPSCYRLH